MAGFTSTERRYGEYIKPFNLDLIAKALSYKDGKYVEGYNEIQSGINDIAALDILKPEDKGYLLTRLSSLVEGTNNAGTLELGDMGVVKNLDAQISQSVDENVVNAYQSTRQIRAFQSHVKEISEKDGGKAYSTLNEAYAMQPINQYMSSGKVGEKISNYGALQYTPFKDVEGELQEKIGDFTSKIKDGFVEMPDPNDPRQTLKHDVRGMNDIQIRNFVAGMMGTSYDEQNRINAWGRYQGYSEAGMQALNQDVDTYIVKTSEDIDKQILDLETRKASVKDKGADIEAINGNISTLKSQKSELASSRDKILKNPQMAGGLLEREGVISRASAYAMPLLGKLPDSVVGKNEVYYEDLNQQYKQSELEIRQAELELKVQELELKKLGKLKGDGSAADGTTASGMPKDSGMSYIPGLGVPDPNVDPKAQVTGAILGLTSEVDSMTKQANDYVYRMAAQGHEGAKAFIADYEKKSGGKSNGHLFRQLYGLKATDLGLNIVTDAQGNQLFKKSELTAKAQEFVTSKQKLDEINKKYEGSNFNAQVNSQDYLDTLNSSGSNIQLATPNGLVSAKSLLRQRGIIDANGKKLKDVSQDAYVKNTLLANEMLSRVNNSPMTGANLKGNLKDMFSNDKANGIVQFDKSDLIELSRIYGERIDKAVDSEGSISKGDLRKVAPKLYNALQAFNDMGVTGNARISSSSNTKRAFRTEVNDEAKIARNVEYNQLLGGIKVPGKIVITDMKSNSAQTVVRNILGFTNAEGTAKKILERASPDDFSSIIFNVANEKGEMTMEVVVKNGKENERLTVKIDTESMQRNAPELMNQINFQQKSHAFSQPVLGNKPVQSSSDGISYLNPSSNFIYTQQVAQNVMKEFSGLPGYEALARGLRKDDAQNYLSEKVRFSQKGTSRHFYNDILSAPISQQEKIDMIKAREEQLVGGVQALVGNSSKFVITGTFINKDSYAVELKDRKTGQSVYQSVHAGDNLESFHGLLDDYESAAYTMILSQILDSEIQSKLSGNKGSTTQFKNLFGI